MMQILEYGVFVRIVKMDGKSALFQAAKDRNTRNRWTLFELTGLPLNIDEAVRKYPTKQECWPGSLGTYSGGVNHTKSGIPCKVWNDESPSSSVQKPEGERAETNFCSEVGDGKAWCYKEHDLNFS